MKTSLQVNEFTSINGEQCQSMFLALARQNRNEVQNRQAFATRNHSAA
jgi:hypothetical protein